MLTSCLDDGSFARSLCGRLQGATPVTTSLTRSQLAGREQSCRAMDRPGTAGWGGPQLCNLRASLERGL